MLSLLNLLGDPTRGLGIAAPENSGPTAEESGFGVLFAAAAELLGQPPTPIGDGTSMPPLPGQRQTVAAPVAAMPTPETPGEVAARAEQMPGQTPERTLPSAAVAEAIPLIGAAAGEQRAPTAVHRGAVPALVPAADSPRADSSTSGASMMVARAPEASPAAPQVAATVSAEGVRRVDSAAVTVEPRMPAPDAEAHVPDSRRAATVAGVLQAAPAVADAPAVKPPEGRPTPMMSPAMPAEARAGATEPSSNGGVSADPRQPQLDAAAGAVVDAAIRRTGEQPATASTQAMTSPTSAASIAATAPMHVPRPIANAVADDTAATNDRAIRSPHTTTPADRGALPEAVRVRQAAHVMRQWSTRAAAAEPAQADATVRHPSVSPAPASTPTPAAPAPPSPGNTAGLTDAATLSLANGQAAAEQLVQRVLQGQARHTSNVRFNLSPAELGQLDVQMRRHGDRVDIAFTASHAGARDLIEASLPSLRSLLQDVGIQLADVDVRHDARDQARSGGQASSDQHGNGGSGGADHPDQGVSGSESMASPDRNGTSPRPGGIDAFA